MDLWLIIIVGILGLGAFLLLLRSFLRYRANNHRMLNMVFLYVALPKKEGKEDREKDREAYSSSGDFKEVLGVMEHLVGSLNSISSGDFWNRYVIGQDFLSLEYAAVEGQMKFYIGIPNHFVDLVEKQITSFYPDAYIEEVSDYNIFQPQSKVAACYMKLKKHFKYPIKTYQQLKSDPFNSIANAFSKISAEEGAAIQLVVTPEEDWWKKQCNDEAQRIYNKKKEITWWNPLSWLGTIFRFAVYGATEENLREETDQSSDRVTPVEEEQVKAIESKASMNGFSTIIRVVASAPTEHKAKMHLTNIVSAFVQFSDARNNGLTDSRYSSVSRVVKGFIMRNPWGSFMQWLSHKKMILGAEEICSIFHFPNVKYNRGGNIDWQMTKISRPPKNLPNEGLLLGTNISRGQRTEVRMKLADRFRHLYVIGQTGMGKSQLIEFLAKQDVQGGNGCCIVDPHGDLVEDILGWIPRSRADDVVVFDPADLERPMGLNMLEANTPEEQDFVALEAMNMMIKLFGNEIFGPRIQDYFRNGCLTLMEDEEEGGAITDIVRLFTDDEWQKYKVKKVKNPIVKSFWEKQMAQTGQREKQEMIPYFAAKFGQFVTNTMMRNILGQTKSAFDFSDIMDNRKILLVKLAKGLVGDINANLLGMIFVNKIQVAAMRRQNVPKEQRRDFFLYVDEFQNFVTEAFESILSEARKYRLGLIIAHQYIGQLIKDGKDETIKNAVFGNVGTMLNFKIGAADAEYMAKEMAPTFSDQDLINLRGFQTCLKLSVDNIISQPFSMNTYKVWELPENKDFEAAEAYKQLSRLKYGREKDFVQREILRRIGA